MQGLLAIFAVLYPVAVGAMFFLILWKKPTVLYAPRDYPDQPGIGEYANAVSSNTGRSLENLEKVVRSVFETVVVPQLTSPDDDQMRASLVEEAVETAREQFEQRVIQVDIGGIHPSLTRTPLAFPVTDSTTVTDLLDAVYYAIAPHVRTFTYNKAWVLADAKSGRLYTDIGNAWARSTINEQRDWRPLDEAGIEPGARLRAVWLSAERHLA